jgi:hypothetical protein
MTSRIGIELSSSACRLIQLERPRSGPRPIETPLLAFAALPLPSAQAVAALASLRGRTADVVVWTRSDHRQVAVVDGPYVRMRVEARRRARAEYGRPTRPGGRPAFGDVDLEVEATVADIAPTPDAVINGRRTVLLASAPAGEVAARLGPLVAAGVKIGAVLTPAAALQSLARSRRSPAGPRLEVYVALGESASCVALMQDGMLVAARDLPWGFLDIPKRDDLAARLAQEVHTFTSTYPNSSPLEQVSLCGGMPELRSMSVALMERLDVEVEPLDSLFGIDAQRLPQRAADFRERAADFRLAWAAASESPSVDLYRGRRRHAMRANLSLAVAAAGALAGLAVGWQMDGWWGPAQIVRTRVARLEMPERPVTRVRAVLPQRADVTPPAADVVEPAVATTLKAERALPPPLRAAERSAPNNPVRETVLPFNGVLETILYGPERRLAIVNGRIVQTGDAISGSRVVEITETALVLRNRDGSLRRLALAGNGE